MAGPLAAGTPAPEFAAPDQFGKEVRLSHFRGRPVILYFYPKDESPGCTAEACTFRDQLAGFQQCGALVIGVSTDSVDSHRRFAERYSLPFTLVADVGGSICRAYGVLGSWGSAARTTFVLAPDGTIRRVIAPVIPQAHVAEALQSLAPARP